MKAWLIKLKNLARSTRFFWRMTVIFFFIFLSVIFAVSLVFRINLDQDLGIVTTDEEAGKEVSFDPKKVNSVLEQIKIRSAELASTTANLPVLVDPSR